MSFFQSIKDHFSPLKKGLKAIYEGDYDKAYKIAAKSYKKNNGDDSLKIVEELRKYDYSSHDLIFLEAMIHSLLGNKREALDFFDKFLKIEPKNIFAMANRMVFLDSLGLEKESYDYLNYILDNFDDLEWDDSLLHHFGGLDIDKEWMYLNLIQAKISFLNRFGHYDEALEMAEKYCNRGFDDSAFYNDISTSYFHLGDYDKALYYVDKALEISRDGVLLTNKGDVLAKLGKHNKAIKLYNEALLYGEGRTIILQSKGHSYMALGNYKYAYKSFKTLVEELDKVEITTKYTQERYDDALEQMAILEEKMKEKKFKFF